MSAKVLAMTFSYINDILLILLIKKNESMIFMKVY